MSVRCRWLCVAIAIAPIARAQVPSKADSAARRLREVQEAQTDPTAPVLLVTHSFTSILHRRSEASRRTSWLYEFSSSVPFSVYGSGHVLGASVSTVLAGPEPFVDPAVSYLVTGTKVSAAGLYRRWAVGVHLEAVPPTDAGARSFAIAGPAVELFGEATPSVMGGIAVASLFGQAANRLDVTPTLQAARGPWWFATANTFEYDVDARRWSHVPLGVTVGYAALVGGQYVDVFVTPVYGVATIADAARWSIELGIGVAPKWPIVAWPAR